MSGEDITDSHVHLLPGRLGERVRAVLANAAGGRLAYPEDASAVLAQLRGEGVRRVWSLPYAHKPDVAGWLNGAEVELVRSCQYTQTDIEIVIGATVHPGDDAPAAIVRHAVEEGGARVLKLHCAVGSFAPDHPRLTEVWRYAAAVRLPVVVHAGHTGRGLTDTSDVAAIDRVAEANVEVPLIVAHCGQPATSDVFDLLARRPNVFADLTPVMARKVVATAEVLEAFAPRLLFGSDAPNTTSTVTSCLEHLHRVGLTAAALDAILEGNARRLTAGVIS